MYTHNTLVKYIRWSAFPPQKKSSFKKRGKISLVEKIFFKFFLHNFFKKLKIYFFSNTGDTVKKALKVYQYLNNEWPLKKKSSSSTK